MKDAGDLAALVRDSAFARNVCVAKLPHTYVAMDTETTGLDPVSDGIVEIAGVKVVDDRVVDVFRSFSRCEARMSREARAVNGITPEMLEGAPSERDAVGSFLEFSYGFVFVAHNAKFDRSFVQSVCASSRGMACPNDWFDTLDEARRFDCGRKLGDLCEAFGVSNVHAHSALGDAEALHLVHQSMMAALLEVSTDARDFGRFERDDGPLAGEVLSFTGEGNEICKHDAMALAAGNGAKLSNNVTKKVTVLVNLSGDESGKTRKAAEYAPVTGVRTVTERQFLERVGCPSRGSSMRPEPSAPAADRHAAASEDIIADAAATSVHGRDGVRAAGRPSSVPPSVAAAEVARQVSGAPPHDGRARAQAIARSADGEESPGRNRGRGARAMAAKVALRIAAAVSAFFAFGFLVAVPESMGKGTSTGVVAIVLAVACAALAARLWRAGGREGAHRRPTSRRRR